MERKQTRTVKIGEVKLGGNNPIAIQSMTKTDTRDISATIGQINLLEKAGCEIVRLAVKDDAAARAIRQIKKEVNIPIVADIHFDYRLALTSIESGADKIRINPGNLQKVEHINAVIDSVAEKGVPIRVGINSGSLSEISNGKGDSSEIMVESLLKYLVHFEKKNFKDIVLSLKSSEVGTTVKAYEAVAKKCEYPLHLGITAAGSYGNGIVKSSMGIGALLLQGIGDTIRVSLTGDPIEEVVSAKRILASAGVRSFGPEIISCPTCGRCQVDLLTVVDEVEKELNKNPFINNIKERKPFLVAIMGCEVNGPGEAGNADIGIAFGKDKGAIFSHGKIVKIVSAEAAVETLLELIREEYLQT